MLFKYKIRDETGKIYLVRVRYDKAMSRHLGTRSYGYSLKDPESGLIIGCGTVSGAEDTTQALIWVQHKEYKK